MYQTSIMLDFPGDQPTSSRLPRKNVIRTRDAPITQNICWDLEALGKKLARVKDY